MQDKVYGPDMFLKHKDTLTHMDTVNSTFPFAISLQGTKSDVLEIWETMRNATAIQLGCEFLRVFLPTPRALTTVTGISTISSTFIKATGPIRPNFTWSLEASRCPGLH